MKNILIAIAGIALFSGAPAMADDDHGAISVAEMQTLTGLAIDDFSKENEHAQHLTGWKTWRSGDAVKVKIYVTHDGMNMEVDYQCHKHGDGKLQCHSL
jgi:hypothetical protein